ncbi:MAG: hypothetical protein ACU0A8_15105 [Limimaricola soesokkakensis]|uniref:hypothetical protein n=1 Tax=Limimaricola soesokkakensis TaxID=1343159 RepID=UPI0040596297
MKMGQQRKLDQKMSEPVPLSLAERLEKRAAKHLSPTRASCLQQIIEVRRTLRRLRNQGHSSAQLAAWLKDCDVPVSDGTVRVYLSRIDRAEMALAIRHPDAEPSDCEILKEYQRNLTGVPA